MRIDVMRVPGPGRTGTLLALLALAYERVPAGDERERRFLERRIEDL